MTPGPRTSPWLLVAALGRGLALVLLLATEVAAQAGGGGSFGGGGGSGGDGDGGDGEFLFYLVYLLIRLVIEFPLLGIPLLILVAILAVVGSRSGWFRHQERVIRKGRGARQARIERVSGDELRKRDPGFDPAEFGKRVQQAFMKVQECWCDQDLRPVRCFVSDGIYERFSLQIEDQQRDGWRQGMADVELQGPPRLVHVGSDTHFDTATVRIDFRADIHRLAIESGARVAGSQLNATRFSECWSFLRRRGVQTVPRGLLEGNCPNCAAPLELNASTRCPSCKSEIQSGQYDWVLAEITQASEWSVQDTAAVPGLEALQQRDPDLNLQHLEDRASVMFWRWTRAERDGSTDALRKVATQRLLDSSAVVSSAPGEHPPDDEYLGDRAVGSVKTLALIPGDVIDRAIIEVVWDGRRVPRSGDALASRLPRLLHRSLLVVVRSSSARTQLDQALSSAHCTRCGAPGEGGTAAACAFCGEPLHRGGEDWLLDQLVRSAQSAEGRALRDELRDSGAPGPGQALRTKAASEPSRAALLRWALRTARADGNFSPQENEACRKLAARLEIPEHRLELLLQNEGPGGANEPPDASERPDEHLATMIEMALADGHISGAEQRLIESTARGAGLARSELHRLTANARRNLYQQSRADLREQGSRRQATGS